MSGAKYDGEFDSPKGPVIVIYVRGIVSSMSFTGKLNVDQCWIFWQIDDPNQKMVWIIIKWFLNLLPTASHSLRFEY